LLRNGRVQWAGGVYTVTLWLLLTWIAYSTRGGVSSSVYHFQVIVVFIAGVLFGWRVSLFFAGLSILIGMGFIYLDYANLVSFQLVEETPL
jgi:hypothetical protein